MADRTVRVRLVADVAQYRREIANATQQTQDIRAATQEVGSGLQKAGAGMIAAGAAMAFGLYKAGRAAADLEQSVGSTEAVFHEASSTIDAFADDSVEAMGLSERAFRDATTEIGGALRRYGFSVDEAASKSIELTQIGADLAATYGGTTADAVHALARAFAGEADPAERFNLDLRASAVNAKAVELGLAASTSQVDGHTRAQALLAVIMEQSADAQGQFARESDTATVQMQKASAAFENFQAAVGQVVAPILGDLAGLLQRVSEGFTSLPPGVQEAISKVAIGTSGLLGFAGAASFTIGTILKLRQNIEDLSNVLSGSGGLSGLLSRVAVVSAPAIAGLGLFGIALFNAADDARNTRARVEGLADGIREFGSVTEAVRRQLDAGDLFDWDNLGMGAVEFNEILETVGLTADDLANRHLTDLIAQLRTQGEAMGVAQGDIDKVATALRLMRDEQREAAAQAATTNAVMGATESATEGLTGATEESTDAYEENERAIEDWQDAVREATGLSRDLEVAQADARDALQEYQDTLRDTEATEDDVIRARDRAMDSFEQAGQAAYDSAFAQESAAGRAATAQQAATASQIWELSRIANSLAPGSALRMYLQQYINDLQRASGTFTATLVVREASPGAGSRFGARQSGGYVGGSGSGDIVPTMLEPGEFVVRKKAAAALGPSAMYRINRADVLGLASGGYAGVPAGWSGPTIAAAGGVIDLKVYLGERELIDTMVSYEHRNGPIPITVRAVSA